MLSEFIEQVPWVRVIAEVLCVRDCWVTTSSNPTYINYSNFGSWLRTIRQDVLPSKAVTTMALRNCLPEFLMVSGKSSRLVKFIIDRIDSTRAEGYRLVAVDNLWKTRDSRVN